MATREPKVEDNDMVRLVSSDGQIFDVKKAVATQSVFVEKMLAMGTENPIPLENMSSNILEKVVKYCEYHVDHPPRPMKTADDIDDWDKQFLNIDHSTLFHLANAAYFLQIGSLTDLVCQSISQLIHSCETPEKIREMFHIENDFTPEEEDRVRRSNRWAFPSGPLNH